MDTVSVGKAFAQRLSDTLTGSGVPWEAVRPIADDEALVITDDFNKTEDFLWASGFDTDWAVEGLKVTKRVSEDTR